MLTLTGNGRLTKKPELRETTSGAKVTTVAIASSRRGSDDDPIYVELVLWDAHAAFAAQHLVKGQAVTFTGRLEPREWTDRDGNTRTSIEVHAVELEYGAKPRSTTTPDPAEGSRRNQRLGSGPPGSGPPRIVCRRRRRIARSDPAGRPRDQRAASASFNVTRYFVVRGPSCPASTRDAGVPRGVRAFRLSTAIEGSRRRPPRGAQRRCCAPLDGRSAHPRWKTARRAASASCRLLQEARGACSVPG